MSVLAKPRPKKKTKASKKVQIVAVRTRVTKVNTWLPDKAYILLETGSKLAIFAGWSLDSGTMVSSKLLTEDNLAGIYNDWIESFGKSWKFVVE